MEQKTFVGYGYGIFKNDNGEDQPYCNIFVVEPFTGEESDRYHFGGEKAVKYKCASPDVFKDIPFGANVLVFFDSRARVCHMQLAK